jgi:hypothetical protein
MQNVNLEAALNLIAHGLFVFPTQGGIGPDSKKPHRAIGSWPNAATTSEFRIRDWWATFPNALPAVACEASKLVVIDADRHGGADGVAAWDELVAVHGEVDAPTVQTPNNGRHLYFRIPAGMAPGDRRGALPGGIDVKSKGYVCGIGSTLADGRVYTQVGGDLTHIPLLPDFARALIEAKRADASGIPSPGRFTRPRLVAAPMSNVSSMTKCRGCGAPLAASETRF